MTDESIVVRLCEVISPSSAKRVANPQDFPLLTVRLHGAGVEPAGKYPSGSAGGRPHFVRPPGQLLIGRQNIHRGSAGIVPTLDVPHVTSNAISAFDIDADAVLPPFLLWLILAPSFGSNIEAVMGGTGQKEVSEKRLLEQTVCIPPLSVQRRIVDLMAHLDNHIANLRAEREALEHVLTSIRANVPSGSPKAVKEIVTAIEGGRSPVTPGDPPVAGQARLLKLSAVRPGSFDGSEAKGLLTVDGMPDAARVRVGDLLMTRSNTPDRVGYCARVRDAHPDTYMPDLIWRIVVDPAVCDPDYFEQYFSSPAGRAAVCASATGTSQSMKKINKAGLASLIIPVPTLSAQRRYSADCLAVADLGRDLHREARMMTDLRRTLLDRLLARDISIPETYDALLEQVA